MLGFIVGIAIAGQTFFTSRSTTCGTSAR